MPIRLDFIFFPFFSDFSCVLNKLLELFWYYLIVVLCIIKELNMEDKSDVKKESALLDLMISN